MRSPHKSNACRPNAMPVCPVSQAGNPSPGIRLRADVPFGAFLSGGVDSSTIVGLMARHVKEPVKTFCIGFEDPRYDESAFAAQAARRFGCQHTAEVAELNMLGRWPMVLHHLDQPHGDASFMPTLRVSELAAKHVKVVLTGDGGDELFAGYDKYAQFFARPDALTLPQADFERAYFDSISLFSPAAKAALEHGFPVLSDKPATFNLAEAKQLRAIVKKSKKVFVLTHNYTGNVMVKQARELVRNGTVGDLRKVVVEYPQGLAQALDRVVSDEERDLVLSRSNAATACGRAEVSAPSIQARQQVFAALP